MKLTVFAIAAFLATSPAVAAENTHWRFETSMKFDALCLTGVMGDDPYYVRHYQAQHDALAARLTPQAREAYRRIVVRTKADKDIATAWLALVFSATDAQTLPQMIAATEHPDAMKRKLQASRYWQDASWERFEALRPDILTILKWLRDIDFPAYWQTDAEPGLKDVIAEVQPQFESANVVPWVEQVLGRKLDSDEITVVAARYCRPHGIRITGARFLIDPTLVKIVGIGVVGGTSVHEMLHPPFDSADSRIQHAIAAVRNDPFIRVHYDGHNPAFGYNTFEGYFNEDSTQALDQVINEQLGFRKATPVERWKNADDGMHVLAWALYTLMKQEDFLASGDYPTFLDRMVREGKLASGKIEGLAR